MTPTTPPGLTWLNSVSAPTAHAALRHICASQTWAGHMTGQRPFPDAATLLAAGDAATAALGTAALAEAMAGHPRIGDPRPGDPASAREQHGMASATDPLRSEMYRLTRAYEEKFGHVFLICATGLGAVQMRDALRARLASTPEAELDTARGELVKINRLRLTRLATSLVTVSTHVLDLATGRPASGIPVEVAVRAGPDGAWNVHATAGTDADGRCRDVLPLPENTTHARLSFAVHAASAFFPEVTATFTVSPGEHYHVPLLLTPFGYSVYRGS